MVNSTHSRMRRLVIFACLPLFFFGIFHCDNSFGMFERGKKRKAMVPEQREFVDKYNWMDVDSDTDTQQIKEKKKRKTDHSDVGNDVDTASISSSKSGFGSFLNLFGKSKKKKSCNSSRIHKMEEGDTPFFNPNRLELNFVESSPDVRMFTGQTSSNNSVSDRPFGAEASSCLGGVEATAFSPSPLHPGGHTLTVSQCKVMHVTESSGPLGEVRFTGHVHSSETQSFWKGFPNKTVIPFKSSNVAASANSYENPHVLCISDQLGKSILYAYIFHAVKDVTDFVKVNETIKSKVPLLKGIGFLKWISDHPHLINSFFICEVLKKIRPEILCFRDHAGSLPIGHLMNAVPQAILPGDRFFVFNSFGVWYSVDKESAVRAVCDLHVYVEQYVMGQGWLKRDVLESDNKMVGAVFLILMSCVDYMAFPEGYRNGPKPTAIVKPTVQEWR